MLLDFINPMQFPGAENLVPAALKAAHGAAQEAADRPRRDGPLRQRQLQSLALGIQGPSNRLQSTAGRAGGIASLLGPGDDDLTILKPLHSAFHSTPLEHLLNQLKARELIVVGLAADMCVHLTAMDAYMRGYKVWVPRDCTAAESEEFKKAALRQMGGIRCCHCCKAMSENLLSAELSPPLPRAQIWL